MAEEEGATMTSKHPKRCETCGKLWKTSCPYYAWIEKGNIGISCDSYIEFTAIVGCASHSSASEPVRLCDDCNILEMEDKITDLELQVKQEREKASSALVNLSVAISLHWPCTLNEIKYLIDVFRDDIQQGEP